MRKIIIPDTQIVPGCPIDHMEWIGKYIVDMQPDYVIHLGDHYDMHSLSHYDRGKLKGEGARVEEDIKAGNNALKLLMKPINKYNKEQTKKKKKQYLPSYHALIGNHEQRIMRYVNDNPELAGTLSYDSFDWDKYGWEVHDFLQVVNLEGVRYSHFFINPKNGRPYGGMIETRLKNIGFSFTQGHVQGLQTAMRELPDSSSQRGLVAGSCYLHDQEYRGPQASHEWRGILVKNEVENGQYDLMEVSLNYLCEKYQGVPLKTFMKTHYNVEWEK